MSPTLAVALFDLWLGALVGLPAFGDQSDRIGGQRITLKALERDC